MSASFAASNTIKDIILIRMKRANGICQKTLKLTNSKMRKEPFLLRETFLLPHPLSEAKL